MDDSTPPPLVPADTKSEDEGWTAPKAGTENQGSSGRAGAETDGDAAAVATAHPPATTTSLPLHEVFALPQGYQTAATILEAAALDAIRGQDPNVIPWWDELDAGVDAARARLLPTIEIAAHAPTIANFSQWLDGAHLDAHQLRLQLLSRWQSDGGHAVVGHSVSEGWFLIRWGWRSGTHGGSQEVRDRRIVVRGTYCELNLDKRPRIAVAKAIRRL